MDIAHFRFIYLGCHAKFIRHAFEHRPERLLSNPPRQSDGFYSLASNLAVMLGSALMGPVYVHFGYHTVGLVCALITLVGCIVSFVSYKR